MEQQHTASWVGRVPGCTNYSRSRCKHWYSAAAADKRCRSTSVDRFRQRISSERIPHQAAHLSPPTHRLRVRPHTSVGQLVGPHVSYKLFVCTEVFDQLNAFIVIIPSLVHVSCRTCDTICDSGTADISSTNQWSPRVTLWEAMYANFRFII